MMVTNNSRYDQVSQTGMRHKHWWWWQTIPGMIRYHKQVWFTNTDDGDKQFQVWSGITNRYDSQTLMIVTNNSRYDQVSQTGMRHKHWWWWQTIPGMIRYHKQAWDTNTDDSDKQFQVWSGITNRHETQTLMMVTNNSRYDQVSQTGMRHKHWWWWQTIPGMIRYHKQAWDTNTDDGDKQFQVWSGITNRYETQTLMMVTNNSRHDQVSQAGMRHKHWWWWQTIPGMIRYHKQVWDTNTDDGDKQFQVWSGITNRYETQTLMMVTNNSRYDQVSQTGMWHKHWWWWQTIPGMIRYHKQVCDTNTDDGDKQFQVWSGITNRYVTQTLMMVTNNSRYDQVSQTGMRHKHWWWWQTIPGMIRYHKQVCDTNTDDGDKQFQVWSGITNRYETQTLMMVTNNSSHDQASQAGMWHKHWWWWQTIPGMIRYHKQAWDTNTDDGEKQFQVWSGITNRYETQTLMMVTNNSRHDQVSQAGMRHKHWWWWQTIPGMIRYHKQVWDTNTDDGDKQFQVWSGIANRYETQTLMMVTNNSRYDQVSQTGMWHKHWWWWQTIPGMIRYHKQVWDTNTDDGDKQFQVWSGITNRYVTQTLMMVTNNSRYDQVSQTGMRHKHWWWWQTIPGMIRYHKQVCDTITDDGDKQFQVWSGITNRYVTQTLMMVTNNSRYDQVSQTGMRHKHWWWWQTIPGMIRYHKQVCDTNTDDGDKQFQVWSGITNRYETQTLMMVTNNSRYDQVSQTGMWHNHWWWWQTIPGMIMYHKQVCDTNTDDGDKQLQAWSGITSRYETQTLMMVTNNSRHDQVSQAGMRHKHWWWWQTIPSMIRYHKQVWDTNTDDGTTIEQTIPVFVGCHCHQGYNIHNVCCQGENWYLLYVFMLTQCVIGWCMEHGFMVNYHQGYNIHNVCCQGENWYLL